MSFREFTANILSTRDYKETHLEEKVIADIIAYLREINAEIGSDKGFSFVVLENGDEVFNDLEGVGGYSGVMIKSPHYIALTISKEDPEIEFYGAYYMQSIVKKLYEMNLSSCWINVRSIPHDKKSKLVKYDVVNMNYLLAFGMADEKAIKQKTPHMTVTNEASSYKQDPYGTKVHEAAPSDKARHSLGEIVYLYEWGRQATYEELESRGMEGLFFYVRNAPSYKNLQPCRLILKDGETELAILHPQDEGSYTDAGIMMYTLEGLAKDLGIPGKWHFINDESKDKEYRIVAKIEL
ncbi:MAG TPA: nitroreductase family protein [Patescibacteria group bacterium]|nr:nitroreductase family protein [Patescibacteria group bacterium]